MISLRPPSDEALTRMVGSARAADMTSTPGLLDRDEPFWFTDRHAEVVGHGEPDFAAAVDSIRDWAKFRQAWTRPALPLAPIEVGATVGYTAQVHGMWWSYCCRIVEVIEDVTPDGVKRWGFTYVTLEGHAECGEERFLVSHRSDGAVEFELFAKSRPGRWYTWVGLPLARRAQARFRSGAAAAVRSAVERSRREQLASDDAG